SVHISRLYESQFWRTPALNANFRFAPDLTHIASPSQRVIQHVIQMSSNCRRNAPPDHARPDAGRDARTRCASVAAARAGAIRRCRSGAADFAARRAVANAHRPERGAAAPEHAAAATPADA